ncbi:anhydro-N-acetylmuramic acid kinase-like [Gigantopelta aegis]|uniref:anhydro-N-acetylmuramic acid kinase-like n=1 Tax=Gigantopelta aegis TaxID=1735272 RepID=UPI001B888B0D|nr:anhydro-N-acetylmuramic acid kinase-like [Gigantopelta aegis]
MATYSGIGIMSGTSVDGLDLCYVEFTGDICSDVWGYCIKKAVTVPYTDDWVTKLKEAPSLSGLDLIKLHVEYGHFVGQCVSTFIDRELIKVDFVSSHGHTVFHQPEKRFTFQLGCGETTSTHLRCPLVCDFRSKDVALGGQGAPLVPSGEKYLFRQSDICINLGGIANIGLRGDRAYDICACNMVLNRLASKTGNGLGYDKDGQTASEGHVVEELLSQLEALKYYTEPSPKSLGYEGISQVIFPLLDEKKYSVPDMLHTFVEHVARQVTSACKESKITSQSNGSPTVLITGGGAFNKFLMKNMEKKLKEAGFSIQETDEDTINFKEALVFAFLGLRTLLGLDNVISATTGSSTDSVSGSIHRPVTPVVSSPSIQGHFNFMMKRQSIRSPPVSSF